MAKGEDTDMSDSPIFTFRPIKFTITMITAVFSVVYFGWAVLIPLAILSADLKSR